MQTLLVLAAAAPPSSDPPSVDSSGLVNVLVILGVGVGILVLYLLGDWIRSRKETRKLEARRRLAKEHWQEELKAMNTPKAGR